MRRVDKFQEIGALTKHLVAHMVRVPYEALKGLIRPYRPYKALTGLIRPLGAL